jgi:hypothetical protein
MRYLIPILLVYGLTLVSNAHACETVATARLDSTCVVMTVGPTRGVWFRESSAEDLRAAWQELPSVRTRADAAEALADLETRRADLYRGAYEVQETALAFERVGFRTLQERVETLSRPEPFALRLLRVGLAAAGGAALGAVVGALKGELAYGAGAGAAAGATGGIVVEVLR